jgi:TATA-binding protein-associated factor
MVSQTLASLLIHMPQRSVLNVHTVLLQMIRQDFAIPRTSLSAARKGRSKTRGSDEQRAHVWEVRHAGLLGIKYEVAVRSDLFQENLLVKQEDGVVEDILNDVVEAAILGYAISITLI